MSAYNLLVSFFSPCEAYKSDSSLFLGKVVKQVAKFFVALFIYFVANAVIFLMFNGTQICSPMIFQAIASGLRVFIVQIFTLASSIVADYGFCALLALAGVIGFGFVFVEGVYDGAHRSAPETVHGNESRNDIDVDGGRCSYKYHIQFLC